MKAKPAMWAVRLRTMAGGVVVHVSASGPAEAEKKAREVAKRSNALVLWNGVEEVRPSDLAEAA